MPQSAESSLPRELQLIIDDIVQQNVHLLEWEVFGNTTEDMRVVLTWRHIEFAKNSRWNVKQIGKAFGDEDEADDDAGSEELEDYWRQEALQEVEEEPEYPDQPARVAPVEVIPVEVVQKAEAAEKKAEEVQLARVETANLKLEESEQINLDEEVDLNAKRDIEPAQAKRMVNWQRKKFSVSIEMAELDEKELMRRFPDGIMATLYGENWDSCCPTDHGDHDDEDRVPGMNTGMKFDSDAGKYVAGDGEFIDVDATIAIYIRPDGNKLEIDHSDRIFYGRDGSCYDVQTGQYCARDGSVVIIDPSINMYMTHDGSSMVIDMESGKFVVYDGRGLSIDPNTGKYIGYDGRDMGTNRTNLYGMYATYDMRGMFPGMFGTYKGSGFVYNPKMMAYGYEQEYSGELFVSKRIKKRKMKPRQWGPGAPVIRIVEPCYDAKGWMNCVDCRYNDFCDKPRHKDEYIHLLWEDEKRPYDAQFEECKCNVCTGGAVHNGCFYRELLRLKSEYLTFDKNNYCFCSECIPFKYRRTCLRTELRQLRLQGSDHYYRLTTHEGDDGIVRNQNAWADEDSDGYGSDEEANKTYGFMQAILLNDIKIEITRQDKIDYRDCPDCQCNGFCDNIRHKKLYQMLLRIDDEDFGILQDECWCLVCEHKGSAHSGCVERELRRLKYDLMVFDVRNLCYCRECVPFKYRRTCLRQELKMKRRQRGINLYQHV